MESGIDPGQEYGQDYYSYEHGYIFSFSFSIVFCILNFEMQQGAIIMSRIYFENIVAPVSYLKMNSVSDFYVSLTILLVHLCCLCFQNYAKEVCNN